MIAAGDLSMEEIAEKPGYSDVASFYHAFKTWTGTTPSNCRKRHLEPVVGHFIYGSYVPVCSTKLMPDGRF